MSKPRKVEIKTLGQLDAERERRIDAVKSCAEKYKTWLQIQQERWAFVDALRQVINERLKIQKEEYDLLLRDEHINLATIQAGKIQALQEVLALLDKEASS
jgi:hypothetical protein